MDFDGGELGGGITAFFRGNSFAFEGSDGRLDGTYVFQAQSAVPEPGTMLLLGSGVLGLWGLRKRLQKVKNEKGNF